MNDYAGYTIKWVTLPWEREQAYALRRQVFCREQGLFADDDRDEIDDHAHLLVALGCVAGWHDRVVGTVRIHQQSPGVWLGSRLAVDAAYRRQGAAGADADPPRGMQRARPGLRGVLCPGPASERTAISPHALANPGVA